MNENLNKKLSNFCHNEIKSDYVITIQLDQFYIQEFDSTGKTTKDLNKAYLFKDMTEKEVSNIANDIFKTCRCMWFVEEYNRVKEKIENKLKEKTKLQYAAERAGITEKQAENFLYYFNGWS